MRVHLGRVAQVQGARAHVTCYNRTQVSGVFESTDAHQVSTALESTGDMLGRVGRHRRRRGARASTQAAGWATGVSAHTAVAAGTRV